MKCPFCQNEMQAGVIEAGGRGPFLRWLPEGEKYSFMDYLGGKGTINAEHSCLGSIVRVKGNYCPKCRKILFDADLTQ